jgi:hypothetical protein
MDDVRAVSNVAKSAMRNQEAFIFNGFKKQNYIYLIAITIIRDDNPCRL